MNTKIRYTTWLAFFGLFFAGLGGMLSTILSPVKAHYPELLLHLEGGPAWQAFGQEVTASNIYWGYAFSGPLSMMLWALVVISVVKTVPSIQKSKLFLGINIVGTAVLLYFLVAHLLLIGQVLVAISLTGFVLTWFLGQRHTPVEI